MEWKVAPSYENSTIIAVDEKNKKANIRFTCHRCGGSGYFGPVIVDGGICYECKGIGYVSKWVKAYTPEEYDKYVAQQKRAKERKHAQWEAKMKQLEADSEINKKELLTRWGFDAENPMVYIITGGNTYNVKDEIKERGGRYNAALNWHYTSEQEPPPGFQLIAIPFDDVYDWNPRTKKITLKDEAKFVVEAAIARTLPPSKSDFIGTEKERMRDLEVTLTDARAINGAYGTSIMFTFDYNDCVLVWFTSSPPDEDHAIVGHKYLLTATVKGHKIYRNIKQTLVNRCILKEFAI